MLVGNNLNVRKVESLKINYLITASIEVQEQVLHLVELLPRSAQVTLILLFLVLPQLLLCMQPALKILYYLAKNTFIIEARCFYRSYFLLLAFFFLGERNLILDFSYSIIALLDATQFLPSFLP